MRYIKVIIISLLLLNAFFTPVLISAQSIDDYAENFIARVEQDFNILETAGQYLDESKFDQAVKYLLENKDYFEDSNRLYLDGLNYPDATDQEIDIFNTAADASAKILEGITTLGLAANETDATKINALATSGVDSLDAGYALYYNNLYPKLNDLYSSAQTTFLLYVVGLIVGLILLLVTQILYMKQSDTYTLDGIGRKALFKGMRNGALAIFAGFLITLVTLLFLPGSTYYIMWGPVIYGGYLFFKSLIKLLRFRPELVPPQQPPSPTPVT
ncbi:hypothetical protein KC614_00565 [candidate division WWE3 bacterium]|uniref:Uncharacterized protein n=1 Tax=candidate division WWE3 bacterium TaxID=2053526 RepID=A0A955LJ48_UNCKA|nr:hypothetical protein [candidate division WWE3 bacterium]